MENQPGRFTNTLREGERRLLLGRTRRAKVNNINGREAAWRAQELLAAGWTPPEWVDFIPGNVYAGGYYTRWMPPT